MDCTIINGKVYDLRSFMDKHPGGRALLSMAVGRDSTILFESYHMRPEIAMKALENQVTRLEKVKPEDVKTVATGGAWDMMPGQNSPEESFPTPMASELYRTIQDRVRSEVMKPRGMVQGRGGKVQYDTFIVISCWLLCTLYFLMSPSILSGCILGVAGAWMGFGVQHTANHGGTTQNKQLNAFLGWLDDVACGGSSLVWRYHHHISHHLYTNDAEKDQDVFSSFPLLRLDPSQPRQPHHKFQVFYAPVIFLLLYFSVQFQDYSCLQNKKAYHVRFLGMTPRETVEYWLGKIIHFGIYIGLPVYWHGVFNVEKVWLPFLMFGLVGSFTLSWLFIVNHNVIETKPDNIDPASQKDWAQWQIETSATWGGKIASFFTGGLCFQIEHHLFPGIAHDLYPDIQVIVKEECAKRKIPYHGYGDLFSITGKMFQCLWMMGSQDQIKHHKKN